MATFPDLAGTLVRLLAVVGMLWLGLTVFALLVSNRMIFLPPPPSYTATTLPVEEVAVPSGGSVAVLHLPAGSGEFTILHSHGNAEDLGHVAPFLEMLHRRGVGVLAYDYRGYGRSGPGPPSVRRSLEDAEAVYQYAVRTLGIEPGRLILYGSSVGTGPALDLAARHSVAGVVLQSPFMSAYTVMTRVPILPFDPYPNLRRIRDVHSPVLVIHGTRDAVIPLSHGQRLYEAAPDPKQALWVEGAGHNDLLFVAGEAYFDALGSFVASLDR